MTVRSSDDIRTAHRSGLALEIRRNDEVTGYLYPVIPDHWGAGGSVVIRTDALTVLLDSDDTSIHAVEKLPFRIGCAE